MSAKQTKLQHNTAYQSEFMQNVGVDELGFKSGLVHWESNVVEPG